MVGSDNLAGVNIFETLGFGDLSLVQNTNAFIVIISTIFATGILSQIIFFVMKSIKCGMPSLSQDPIELQRMNP